MNVPFLNLKEQYDFLWEKIEPSLKEIFDNAAFIGGKAVQEFENDLETYLDCKYVVGCNSGTDALVLALRACNVRPGDEVITTAFSFFATAEAIAVVGAVPVFVDINENDFTMDVSQIELAITDRTKAILVVQIFGAPCDMDAVMDVAMQHGLKVIEDDAQAIGSKYKGRKSGTLADIGCFSFYPTKNLGCAGDGGAVTTNNEELYIIVKAMHEHGSGEMGAKAALLFGNSVDIPDTVMEKTTDLYNPYKYYNFLIAYNSRLDAIQAAILSVKLQKLDEYNAQRANIAKIYNDNLTSKVKIPVYSEDIVPCWHQYVIKVEDKAELCAYLTENGVGNGSFYPVPLHKQKAFNSINSRVLNGSLPVVEKVCNQTICLPIFPELTEEQVMYVIETVNGFFEGK